MKSRVSNWLTGMATGLLCALLWVPPASAADMDLEPTDSGDALTLAYDVYWHGLKVIKLESRVAIEGRRFSHRSKFRTHGILRLFVKGETESLSTGRFLGFDRRLAARRFETNGRWSDQNYSRRLRFALNGQIRDIEIDMPDEWMDREPVPVSLQRGPDPLSLITWAMTDPWGALAERESRDIGPLTSFDGIRAMEYQLSCEADPREVKKSARTFYVGEARICALSGRQTAGFWRGDDEDDDRDRRSDDTEDEESEYGDQRLEFWLAEAPDHGLYVPVRVDIRSRRGKVRAYLKDFSGTLRAPMSGYPVSTATGD